MTQSISTISTPSSRIQGPRNCSHVFHPFSSSCSNTFCAGCGVQWDPMATVRLQFEVHWTAAPAWITWQKKGMLRAESKPAVFEPPLHQRSGLQRFYLFCLQYNLTVFFICTTAQVFLMHISWATNKYPENTRYIIWFNAPKPFSDNLSSFFGEESSLQREKGHLPTSQKLHISSPHSSSGWTQAMCHLPN